MYNVHLITRKREGKKKNDRKQAGKQEGKQLDLA